MANDYEMDELEEDDEGEEGGVAPYVIFRLGERRFCLESTKVSEILIMPELLAMPGAPAYLRGLLNLRGDVFPVVDLRVKMQMKSARAEADELVAMLSQREEDHKRWLTELEASIKEDREFKLTTDPHACAFGKWYDVYKPTNSILETHLKKFDAPHQKIHGLGVKALELQRRQGAEAALHLIGRERSITLPLMLDLFAEARRLLVDTMREVVIVVSNGASTVGMVVDTVESVEPLEDGSVRSIGGLGSDLGLGSLITHTARTAQDKSMLLMVNGDVLLGDISFKVDISAIPLETAKTA